jgi:hypothetical protein
MDSIMIIVYVFGIIFGVALLLSWIILPFAVFGIKKRLDQIITIMQRV